MTDGPIPSPLQVLWLDPHRQLILGGRQEGRSTMLLLWMTEPHDENEHRIYVGHNAHAAMQVWREVVRIRETMLERAGDNAWHRYSQLESWQFVGFEELRGAHPWEGVRQRPGNHSFVLGIDNFDLVLSSIVHHPISKIVWTER